MDGLVYDKATRAKGCSKIYVADTWVFTVKVFPLFCTFEKFHNKMDRNK